MAFNIEFFGQLGNDAGEFNPFMYLEGYMKQFVLLANYNQWMNESIYSVCQEMGQEKIELDQQAFFSSILKTLNHILIADTFWLYRCSGSNLLNTMVDESGQEIKVKQLDQIIFRSIDALYGVRKELDQKIIDYVEGVQESEINKDVEYRSSLGQTLTRPLGAILAHWFNHQTHHRGQITTLIHQQGYDFGTTDLILMDDVFPKG